MRRVLAVLAPLALLVAAPTAQAAAVGDAFYGGGNLVDQPGPRPGDADIGLVTTSAGDRLRAFGTVLHACGSETGEANAVGDAAIGPDGSFTAKARSREKVGKRRWTHRLTITGRIDGPRATGTVTSTSRVGGRKRCSGTTPFTSVIAAPSTAPAAAAVGGSLLRGLVRTARSVPYSINLRVAPDGASITRLLVTTPYDCGGRRADESFPEKGGTVNPDGTFRIVNRWRVRYRDGVDRARVVIAGRFHQDGTASGTVNVKTDFTSKKSRKVTLRCRSGTRQWAAMP
jgi:hypothetical protein